MMELTSIMEERVPQSNVQNSKRQSIKGLESLSFLEDPFAELERHYAINHKLPRESINLGTMRRCVHRKTGQKFFVKSVQKSTLETMSIGDIRYELNIMESLDHPNIIRLHDVFESQTDIHLIMEPLFGLTLLEKIRQEPDCRLNEMKACNYVKTILSAIRYCHENNIVHRDIKLENFILKNNKYEAELKLIDFGFAQEFKKNESMTRTIGSTLYVAPEVIRGKYTCKCDIWSLGVLTYMMLVGEAPFEGNSEQETLSKILHGHINFNNELFADISDSAKDFLRRCLELNPALRFSAKEAQYHPWLNQSFGICLEVISDEFITRLTRYSQKSVLSRLFLLSLANAMDEKQILPYLRTFQRLDCYHTGFITLDVFKYILSSSHLHNHQIEAIFRAIDIKKTNKVHFHQIVSALLTLKDVNSNNIRLTFDIISRHNDVISVPNVRKLLHSSCLNEYSEDEFVHMLGELNLDAHSEINYSDFKNVLRSRRVGAFVKQFPQSHKSHKSHQSKGNDSSHSMIIHNRNSASSLGMMKIPVKIQYNRIRNQPPALGQLRNQGKSLSVRDLSLSQASSTDSLLSVRSEASSYSDAGSGPGGLNRFESLDASSRENSYGLLPNLHTTARNSTDSFDRVKGVEAADSTEPLVAAPPVTDWSPRGRRLVKDGQSRSEKRLFDSVRSMLSEDSSLSSRRTAITTSTNSIHQPHGSSVGVTIGKNRRHSSSRLTQGSFHAQSQTTATSGQNSPRIALQDDFRISRHHSDSLSAPNPEITFQKDVGKGLSDPRLFVDTRIRSGDFLNRSPIAKDLQQSSPQSIASSISISSNLTKSTPSSASSSLSTTPLSSGFIGTPFAHGLSANLQNKPTPPNSSRSSLPSSPSAQSTFRFKRTSQDQVTSMLSVTDEEKQLL